MLCQKNIFLLFSALSASSSLTHAKTEHLQLKITPIAYLSSGTISDNTLLARIHISGISKGCNLKVWDELAASESIPGRYSLRDKENGKTSLRVKLTGDKWQPTTTTGRGVSQKAIVESSELELRSNGEQTICASIISFHLTAQCVFNNEQP